MTSKSEPVLLISPGELFEAEGFNVRLADDPENIAHIEALAESIFHVGVLEPLTAYKDLGPPSQTMPHYIVTNGHCRLAAVRQAIARGAPIKAVPVRLEPKRASAADHTFSLIARNSGKPLGSLELGIACKRMLAFGWTEVELAQKSGYSTQQIRNVVLLASAPAEVTRLVETGQVSASLATDVLQADAANAGEVLTQAVAEAAAEDAAKPAKQRKAAKKQPVRATKRHVIKAAAKRQKKAPEPSSMMDDDKLVRTLRDCSVATALDLFDGYGKRRAVVFGKLLSASVGPASVPGDDIAELREIFTRAIADTPSADGVVMVAIAAEDWRSAVALLDLPEPAAEAAE